MDFGEDRYLMADHLPGPSGTIPCNPCWPFELLDHRDSVFLPKDRQLCRESRGRDLNRNSLLRITAKHM